MLDAKDIENTLREELGLKGERDLLAFVRMSAIGEVRGGAQAVAAALLAVSRTLVMPAFTPQTQIIPQTGPPDNAMDYGTADAQNAKAKFFRPNLPVHPDMGAVAEALRKDAETLRSTHPVLSFVAQGARADEILAAQTRQNPFGPVALLEANGGALLIIGGDQQDNIALHLAEQRAGRKPYIRWALTLDDIEELPNMPGPRRGFNAIWPDLVDIATHTQVGLARAELIPIQPMLRIAEQRIRQNPDFMLRRPR